MAAPGRKLVLLRSATAEIHASLERRVRLLEDGLDVARYAAYLRALLDVVAPLEAACAALPELTPAWPDHESRRKAHLLRADLAEIDDAVDRHLDHGPRPDSTESTRESLHRAARPDIPDVAAALGVAYVLEGSTLGGAVLKREVEARLGPVPTRYFDCYGAELGPRWQGFLGHLEAAPLASQEDESRLVASAVSTFSQFERSFIARGLCHV